MRSSAAICHILILALFTVPTLPAHLNAQDLTLYTWEDYMADQVIEDFYKKTGIKVKQVFFDSDQIRDETIGTLNDDRFDLVVFDSIAAQIFGKNNRLVGLSESEVPNLQNLDSQWYDRCGNFGTPYFYGTVGIVYDKTKFTIPPDSWDQLLRPSAEHKGHVVMVEDMTDILIPPLLYLGYNVNSEKESELKEAYQLLKAQIPYVLNYKYALTNIKFSDKDKQMHMALAYSGDQYTLNETSGTENWQYVIPKEGTVIWLDCMSIPINSTHKKEALQFLNYLLEPQVVAINTEEIYNPTPVGIARSFMSGEAAEDEELFPPKEFIEKTQIYRILSDSNIRMRRRIFDAVLKEHETQ